jgi:hypothetical protein
MLHHARMSYVCGLGVRPSIRFIVAGSGSKCFTGAAGPDDIIAVPDFFCDWLQMRYVMLCVIVETHISYEIVCCHVQSVVPLLKSASDLHRFVRSQFNNAYTVAMPLPCSNETVLSLRSETLRISKTRCRHADGSL